jgi:hypothetical protein
VDLRSLAFLLNQAAITMESGGLRNRQIVRDPLVSNHPKRASTVPLNLVA